MLSLSLLPALGDSSHSHTSLRPRWAAFCIAERPLSLIRFLHDLSSSLSYIQIIVIIIVSYIIVLIQFIWYRGLVHRRVAVVVDAPITYNHLVLFSITATSVAIITINTITIVIDNILFQY